MVEPMKSNNPEFDLLCFEGGARGLCVQISQQANVCGYGPQVDNRWVEDGRPYNFIELNRRQALTLAADLLVFVENS